MDQTTPGGAQPQTSPATPPSNQIPQANEPGKTASPPPTEVKKPEEILQEANLSTMTESQLADLESGDPARIATALGVQPPPKSTEEGNPAPGGNEDHGPERISLKALPNKETRVKLADAVASFRNGEFSSIEEALAAKFNIKPAAANPEPSGNDGKQPAENTPPAKSENQEFTTPEVTQLESRLAELQKEKDAAKAVYDYDKADEISEQITEVKLELRDAKKAAEAQKGAIAQFQAAEEESRARVMAAYGEHLTDPDSEFNEQLDVEITLAERKNDPILQKPDWPEKIAAKVAKRLNLTGGGIKADPRNQEPHQTEEPDIPPQPRRDIRAPGSPISGGANSSALTPTTALAELEKLSPAEREKVLSLLP